MPDDQIMKALFAQTRLQLLNMKHEDMHRDVPQYLISNAYSYAWVHSVYPIQHDGDDSVPDLPHENFAELFLVSKQRVEEIGNYMDERWSDGDTNPTLENLIDHFGRESKSQVIHVARYYYLLSLFDDAFWEGLQNGQITKEFNPSEIYLE